MDTAQSAQLLAAEALMSERRFSEAITAFELHLAQNPYDLRALLKVGICHLLNRSRGAFLEAHRRAEDAIARIGSVPADVADLWALYRDLVVRVGAATLVAGTLVLSQGGCARSEGTDGGTVAEDAGTRKPPRPAHRYSGGVFLEQRSREGARPEPQQPPRGRQEALVPSPPPPAEPAAKTN